MVEIFQNQKVYNNIFFMEEELKKAYMLLREAENFYRKEI